MQKVHCTANGKNYIFQHWDALTFYQINLFYYDLILPALLFLLILSYIALTLVWFGFKIYLCMSILPVCVCVCACIMCVPGICVD